MLYLIWAILNIGLFVFFLIICLKATSLLREKFGLFVTIIFVFGLFSFVCNSNDKDDLRSQKKAWHFTPRDSLDRTTSFHTKVTLENNLISKYLLHIHYSKTKHGNTYAPISANSSADGFISGIHWTPNYISVFPMEDSLKFEYSVNGTITWKLLGLTLYSKSDEYNGIVDIK